MVSDAHFCFWLSCEEVVVSIPTRRCGVGVCARLPAEAISSRAGPLIVRSSCRPPCSFFFRVFGPLLLLLLFVCSMFLVRMDPQTLLSKAMLVPTTVGMLQTPGDLAYTGQEPNLADSLACVYYLRAIKALAFADALDDTMRLDMYRTMVSSVSDARHRVALEAMQCLLDHSRCGWSPCCLCAMILFLFLHVSRWRYYCCLL